MLLSAGVPPPDCYKTSVRYDLIVNVRKTSPVRCLIIIYMLRNGLLQCFGTFKMPILMFISVLVFRPEGQIWNPVRRDTRIYVRRILNASRISKTQLNSCTISPS